MIIFNCVYEDEPTYLVMRKMLALFPTYLGAPIPHPCNGYTKIKKNIKAYNNAASYTPYTPFFVVTDLDKNECAPSLIRDWLGENISPRLLFRVAVHEIESWLLADRQNFASFFSVPLEQISITPDEIAAPKQRVISLVRKSKKKAIRDDMLPVDQFAVRGPGYNIQLKDFIENHWDINTAQIHSPSLSRAILAIESFCENSK